MRFVYLIKNTEDDTYKIGIAKQPNQRLKQLQTGNSAELIIIETYQTDISSKIEKVLHRNYGTSRKCGEWFTLSLVDELDFIKRCEEIEKSIRFLQDNGNVFA